MIRSLLCGLLLATAAWGGDELTPRGPHPRLFYTPERVAALQARLNAGEESAAWSNVLGQAAAGDLDALCLAFRVTGDSVFAERLRDRLLGEVRKPTWTDPMMLKRDPPWQAGLEVARRNRAVAVGFDSVHDVLTPAERKEIASGLVHLGILPTLRDWLLPGTRIHALDSMGHNWWSACVFSAGLAALAVLDEEPRAAGWLRQIAAGSVAWFTYPGSVLENKPATFDAAGGFYESVNYASFAVSEYLAFRLAWQNALAAPALPDLPHLEQVGDFFLHAAYPNRRAAMSVNFGDGSLDANGSRPLTLLWAQGMRAARTRWYLDQVKDSGFREGLPAGAPLGLLYGPTAAERAAAPAAPDLPTAALYRDMGWAMLRSSWAKDATLLAVKSGTTWNHAHADNGSFLLFHGGEYLLVDSGNCSYSRPEYDDYYRQSAAHNVVLFNGEGEHPGQTYHGTKFPGTLDHLLQAGDLTYLLADATGPNARHFLRKYRHVLWVGDVILLVDDLQTYDVGQLEWLLHVGGEARREGLDLRVTKGAAEVRVRPLFPEPFPDAGLPTDYPERMRCEERSGLADHDPDTAVSYYAFVPAEPERRTKFITAITLVTAANRTALPQLERLRGPDWIGVRVRQGGRTTDVFLNLLADGRIMHRNSNTTIEGWETDALLTVIDQAATPRFLLAHGSYLRRAGKSLVESLQKEFVVQPLPGEARP